MNPACAVAIGLTCSYTAAMIWTSTLVPLIIRSLFIVTLPRLPSTACGIVLAGEYPYWTDLEPYLTDSGRGPRDPLVYGLWNTVLSAGANFRTLACF